jgi:hypothetical protein
VRGGTNVGMRSLERTVGATPDHLRAMSQHIAEDNHGHHRPAICQLAEYTPHRHRPASKGIHCCCLTPGQRPPRTPAKVRLAEYGTADRPNSKWVADGADRCLSVCSPIREDRSIADLIHVMCC